MAILGIAIGYYLMQQRKIATAQFQPAVESATAAGTNLATAEKTAATAGPISPGDSLSLITGETANQAATSAEGDLDRPAGMEWFYKRFGYSTWFAEATFNVKTFTQPEYDSLIKAALEGNESATAALRLTIFKYLKENPDSKDYSSLKEKVDSNDFLLNIPRFEYLADTVPDNRLDNKDFMTALVKKNGTYLKFASDRLRGDKDVVSEAVRQYHYPLEFATDEIKGDRTFGEVLLRINPKTLCYMSDELRNDKSFVEKAVTKEFLGKDVINCSQLMFCFGERLVNSKDFILYLIKQKDLPLKEITSELRNDKDVVLAAVNKNPNDYYRATENLKNAPDVIQIIRAYLMKSSKRIYPPLVPKALWTDREFMKKAVADNCSLLETAPVEIKNDPEIVGDCK